MGVALADEPSVEVVSVQQDVAKPAPVAVYGVSGAVLLEPHRVRKAAEQGEGGAQYRLGLKYENGWGVPEDDAEAVKWFRKAAEQGDTDAQYSLGVMYAKGEGVPKNDAEAAKWFRKAAEDVEWRLLAAEQGNALAQWILGFMYAEGAGVPEDYVLAYAWLNLAAAQGQKEAVEAKDNLRPLMTAAQIAQAQELSATLFSRIQSR